MSRKRSIDIFMSETVKVVTQGCGKLEDLWNKMGLDEEPRRSRFNQVMAHLGELIDSLVEADTNYCERLASELEDIKETSAGLRVELGLPALVAHAGITGLLPLRKFYHNDIKMLMPMKEERMAEQLEALAATRRAFGRLGWEFDAGEIESKIATASELEHLKHEEHRAGTEFRTRLSDIRTMQEDIAQWRELIAEDALFVGIDFSVFDEINFDDDFFELTDGLLESIHRVHDQCQTVYRTWQTQFQARYDVMLSKLSEIDERCGIASCDEDFPHIVHANPEGKEVVRRLEQLISDRQADYERFKNVFVMLKQWKELWDEKVEFDRAGAAKYNTRGGQLQQLLNREQAVNARLKHLQTELEAASADPGAVPLIEGVTPGVYVQQIVERHKHEKAVVKKVIGGTPKKFTVSHSPMKRGMTPQVPVFSVRTRDENNTPTTSSPLSSANSSHIPRHRLPPISASVPTKRKMNTPSASNVCGTPTKRPWR